MSRRGPDLELGSRLLIGAIAGFVGTLAMTSAMAKLHKKLPARERYPLTPREIIDAAAHVRSEGAKDLTTAAHFAYGAACGSLIAAANPRPSPAMGAAAGVAVWLVSYMGWIPAVGLLKPATRHPLRRNALMIRAHLVWGWTMAGTMRQLIEARETIFDVGPDKDVPRRR